MSEETKDTLPLPQEEEALTEEEQESSDTEDAAEPNDREVTADAEQVPQPMTDYAALAESDLKEIKALCHDFDELTHLSELPFARRFAELRDLGLSVREALAAAAPRFEERSTKAHLRTAVPRGTFSPEGSLSHEEMRAAKDLFHGLSEKEINALYRRVAATQ